MTTEHTSENEEKKQTTNTEKKKVKNRNVKYLIVGAILLVVIISVLVFKMLPNDNEVYVTKMKLFAENETKALELYRIPKNSSKEIYLTTIQDKGIYYWNENVKLVNEMEQLNVSDNYHERNKELLQYLDMRIRSYNLIYKTINEGTNQYNDSLRYYNATIKAMLDKLGEK